MIWEPSTTISFLMLTGWNGATESCHTIHTERLCNYGCVWVVGTARYLYLINQLYIESPASENVIVFSTWLKLRYEAKAIAPHQTIWNGSLFDTFCVKLKVSNPIKNFFMYWNFILGVYVPGFSWSMYTYAGICVKSWNTLKHRSQSSSLWTSTNGINLMTYERATLEFRVKLLSC